MFKVLDIIENPDVIFSKVPKWPIGDVGIFYDVQYFEYLSS